MPTTLVTGASSGIGRELAQLFAAAGDNVVLVARSLDKLNEIAEQLQLEHGIQATVITSDLSQSNATEQL
ncbi:MAG: SDR family NAD(P)-dependent oxidoreductase, partial [Aureliella sp.]